MLQEYGWIKSHSEINNVNHINQSFQYNLIISIRKGLLIYFPNQMRSCYFIWLI